MEHALGYRRPLCGLSRSRERHRDAGSYSAGLREAQGKGNVVYIEGIKLDARRPGGWSRTTTASVIADILTSHPDIDAVTVSNDDSAIAIVSALEQRKMKALVSGRDAIKEVVALVAQGNAFNTYAYGPSRREALRRTLLERSRAEPSRPDEQQGPNRHLPILSRPHLRKPPSVASLTSRESARLFAGKPALTEVTLYLNEGEVVGLVGENGAGKSTLLKIISGDLQADAGTISARGREVELRSYQEANSAGIFHIYQDLALVPTMSVARQLPFRN
jgi:ABC-type multidrug transport system fused ATPase/permease subunit